MVSMIYKHKSRDAHARGFCVSFGFLGSEAQVLLVDIILTQDAGVFDGLIVNAENSVKR